MADPKRVLLHIGAPKTGTTYLQRVLDANRASLAEAGVLFPEIRGEAHHSAVWDLRGKFEGTPTSTRFAGHWDLLVRQAAEWSGHTVVVSSEHFVFAEARRAAAIVEAFGDAEVHVVYTARDLARQVPAVWQEQVKNRRTMRYSRYLDDVLGKRKTTLGRHFWKAQDAAAALVRWAGPVPAERIHVVTAPPAGAPADTLWQRFAEVVGIDSTDYTVDLPMANESLGVTAAEVLRRFNERHGRMNILTYRSKVLRPLQRAMADGVNDRSKLPLTAAQRDRIDALSREIVATVRKAGYSVTGDLDDLVPVRDRAAERRVPRGPDDLTDSDLVEAYVEVVHGLLGRPQSGLEADVAEEALDEDRRSPLRRLRRRKG